jgi:cyanophycinase
MASWVNFFRFDDSMIRTTQIRTINATISFRIVLWQLVLILVVSQGYFGMAQDVSVQANQSTEVSAGRLIIVGGGLRATNKAVYEKFLEFAGGIEKARIVVLPTASISLGDSQLFQRTLIAFGVKEEHVQILDVTHKNATTSTADPKILATVRSATALFMSGGDQRRLVRLLTDSSGADTPLLVEMRNLLKRGGVIGGTSAGASAQSETMLAVSGLPDELIDEGLDTLDFGITTHSDHRGLLIAKGFGFFKAGIIDQHFTQYRGRLGRLTRAVADSGVHFGFGIDENTAIVVEPQGPIQIVGAGMVTLIESTEPGKDGPLGYKIANVNLSLLSDGDTFDLRTKQATIAKDKVLIDPEKAEYNGNFLVNDIGAGGAVPFALISGLADNKRSVQEAITVKYRGDYVHGYRFLFSKQETTRAYSAYLNHDWVYSITNIRMDISPIASGLKASERSVPKDIENHSHRHALAAIAFRGVITASSSLEFRPESPITRSEFASALSRSTHLTAPPVGLLKRFSDIDSDSIEGDEILRAVAAGMITTSGRSFQPDQPVTNAEAAAGLKKLIERAGPDVDPSIAKQIEVLASSQVATVKRADIALILHRILRLPES